MSRVTEVKRHEHGVELVREYRGEEYKVVIPSSEVVDVVTEILIEHDDDSQ
jgi:hypothetical protein